MVDIYENPETGEAVKWSREAGEWVPADQTEVAAAKTGIYGDVAGAIHGATGIGYLYGTKVASDLEQNFPTANKIGMAADIGLGVGLIGKAALARKGAKRTARATMSNRIQDKINAATPPPGMGSATPGLDSAGSMAVDMTQLDPSQRPSLFAWIADEFLDPSDLTPEQIKALKVGDEIGFSWLPGQREGRNLLVAGVKSHPTLSGAFDEVLSANRAAFEKSWMRAIGAADDVFERGVVGRRMAEIGSAMDDIGDAIGTVKIKAKDAAEIARIRKIEPDLDALLSGLGNIGADAPVDGRTLMGIRSQLNQLSNQLWTGANANPMRAQAVDALIDSLDELAEGALGPEGKRAWKKLRIQWRNAKLLEDPGVINSQGTLSPARIHNKLAGKGPASSTGYKRRSVGEFSARMDPDTAKAYDWTRVSSLFGDNIGDSGTASRQYIQRVLQGDFKGIAQTVMLKRYLERMALANVK